MGYRSDVAIYLSKEAVNRLRKEFKEVRNYLAELCDNWNDQCLGDGGELYKMSGVKWYVGYPEYKDVNAIEDFLGKLDEEKDECYEFMRIGEDEDDTEHRWTTDEEMMWVDRSINTEQYC